MLGSLDVGAGLVLEQQTALVGAGVDVAQRLGTASVTPVVGEGHGSVERTRHRSRLLAEHREQERVTGYVGAQLGQSVATVTVGWKHNLRALERPTGARLLLLDCSYRV